MGSCGQWPCLDNFESLVKLVLGDASELSNRDAQTVTVLLDLPLLFLNELG